MDISDQLVNDMMAWSRIYQALIEPRFVFGFCGILVDLTSFYILANNVRLFIEGISKKST